MFALAALTLIAGTAGAERAQRGKLIVALDGGISPRKLPRSERAPVAVHLSGRVLTSDNSPLPRVNWIKLELAWRGQLYTHGLPVCRQSRLFGTDSKGAMKACGAAKVGQGSLFAKIFVPNQSPFGVHARLLAFNGKSKVGRPAVWVHAYSSNPPVSFVLPFTVHHEDYRTVLVTTIRRSVGPWPHVANFGISVGRKFDYEGKRRSYLSASCPVPKGFTAGFLSFARATYKFAGGDQLSTESTRSCRAR